MNSEKIQRNVFGEPLVPCSNEPLTGFFRDGCCHTGPMDSGTHTVCAVMTETFLTFTKSKGNDLSTAIPEYNFPGLKAGDRWCLCVNRWRQALEAGCAPPVVLEATNEKTLNIVDMKELESHSIAHAISETNSKFHS